MTAPGEPSAAVVRAQRDLARAELVLLDPRQGPLLAPAVTDLETWSARANGWRPLPGLRRLFR